MGKEKKENVAKIQGKIKIMAETISKKKIKKIIEKLKKKKIRRKWNFNGN